MRLGQMFGKAGDLFIGLIWVVGWTGICLVADVVILRGIVERTWALTYPTVFARVKSSEIRPRFDDDTRSFVPVLNCAYEVNGKTFETAFEGLQGQQRTEPAAQKYLNEHPVDSTIKIYYAGNEPERAFLQVGLTGSDLMQVIFLVPFNLIGIFIGKSVIQGMLSPKDDTSGIKVIKRREGQELRVRLPVWTTRAITTLAFFGYGFLAYPILSVLGRGSPSIWLVLSMLGLVVLFTYETYRRRCKKLESGIFDLVLDLADRTLTLPAGHGRKAAEIYPFGSIKTIKCERETRGDENITFVQCVRVHFRSGDTGEIVVEWSNQAKAERLARWLRRHVLGDAPGDEGSPRRKKPKKRRADTEASEGA